LLLNQEGQLHDGRLQSLLIFVQPVHPTVSIRLAWFRLLSRKSTSIVPVVLLSGSYYGLLRNCYKAKRLQRISQSGWGVGGGLDPIHHWARFTGGEG
jgi:hypothetical protein